MYAIRLLSFLGRYKHRTALSFVCVILSSAAALAQPQLIAYAIDYGLAMERRGDTLVPTGSLHLLVFAAVGVIGVAVARGIFAYGQTYLSEWLGQRVAYDLRNGIYDRLQRLSYAYHDQQQTGQLMSRATQDVESVRWYISMGVLRGAYVLVLLIPMLVLMLIASWQLALVVWLFIPVIAWRASPSCSRRHSPGRAW